MMHEPLESRTLKNGFWPKIRILPMLEDRYMDNDKLQEIFNVNTYFVGRRRDRPPPSFRVGRDVYAGNFVVLRKCDNDSRPVWIARAIASVNAKLLEHPNYLLIWYWKPMSAPDNVQETSDGWDGNKPL
jgi:hypothetical protein